MKVKNKLDLLFICTLAACSQNSIEVHNCYDAYMCSSNGSIIKWQKAAVEFTFDDTAPENLRLGMEDAANDYNDVFEKTDLRVDPNNQKAPRYSGNYETLNKDGINGIYYLKDSWPWEQRIPGSLAVTLTRFSEQGIMEADIFVKNDPSKIESTSQDFKIWIKYISEHELGHALGRTHSKNKSSIMYPSVSLTKVSALSEENGYHDFFSEFDLEVFDLAYALNAALLTSAN